MMLNVIKFEISQKKFEMACKISTKSSFSHAISLLFALHFITFHQSKSN